MGGGQAGVLRILGILAVGAIQDVIDQCIGVDVVNADCLGVVVLGVSGRGGIDQLHVPAADRRLWVDEVMLGVERVVHVVLNQARTVYHREIGRASCRARVCQYV